ncbi:MAG: hypothetical protein ACYDDB_08410 [bacterium]
MENKTVVIFDTETTGFTQPALIEAGGIIIKICLPITCSGR